MQHFFNRTQADKAKFIKKGSCSAMKGTRISISFKHFLFRTLRSKKELKGRGGHTGKRRLKSKKNLKVGNSGTC